MSPSLLPSSPLLAVRELRVTYAGRGGEGPVEAVRGVSWQLEAGRVLAVVGESGSGKTAAALALTRLLPEPPSCCITGEVRLRGTEDLLTVSRRRLREVRGKELAYVFQEPSGSLNPVFPVGAQIEEAIALHQPGVAPRERRERAVAALAEVGLREPARRAADYPHQFSGGMLQRAMIAMALACQPAVLVADEPTTALDVTIQRDILRLLARLRAERGLAILLITHNFGLLRGFADEVAVMDKGRIVEQGPVERVLSAPEHPYTRALIACIPRLGQSHTRLPTVDRSQWEPAETR